MSDYPGQEPDWPNDDADTAPRRRSGVHSNQSSRPNTARGPEEASSGDLQGIYEASNPSTPRILYEVTKMIQQPIFTIVDIDRSFAAQVLEGYIARGSSITGVDVNLLNVTLTSLPPIGQKITVVWLSEHGMPLFDAITWVCADESIRPP
ncbi:hypothetical protein HI914_03731 [Erysiphe necator]|nr:hypothetical protein HI914_03731 [Erysiphe necator]